jgi:hypothetical protein
VTADYTAKLKAVNFSDPDLSRRIGEICRVDAFLVVSLDYWNYTTEATDKVGKIGLSMKLISAAEGGFFGRPVIQGSKIPAHQAPAAGCGQSPRQGDDRGNAH